MRDSNLSGISLPDGASTGHGWALRRSWDVANKFAPALLLTVGVAWVLYLALTKIGQVQDLFLAATEDLPHHFFLTMTLAVFTASGWLMIGSSLRGAEVPDWVKGVIATACSLVGPAILAFAYPAPGTIGAILLYVPGILAPAFGLGFLMTPGQRKGYPVDWWISKLTGLCASLTLVIYGLLFLWPDFSGLLLGPVAVLLVVGGAAMWVVWFLATRLPIVSILLVALIALGVYTGQFGKRAVRTVSNTLGSHDTRIQADVYAKEWLAKHNGIAPLLITSDGGGIRAAYWTALVLGALQDDLPGFSEQVYAASGVSGGSVGIAEFASLLHEEKARSALSIEFLSVSLARLLTRDPLDSVLCFGWGWHSLCSGTDRQASAEWLFEATNKRLGETVSAPLPFAIALNATNADTGERLVMSNIEMGGAEDVLKRMRAGETLRLSTAMLLSARFPIISPVGELTLDGALVRILDGGYFDNSGGATATDMLGVLMKAAGKNPVKPIALLVTNDPLRARGKFCEPPPETTPDAHTSLADLLVTPIGTLDAGRQNSAEQHRQEFRKAVEDAGGQVVELPLFRCKGDGEFPLGWSLSGAVRRQMDDKLKLLRKDENGPYRTVMRLVQ